ncbi:MAG: ABC transporter ATP-binding protein [Deltaproteobacteria bacterium]|nr:ABC transporter ATP-binding protein [Deltaproteobacteria bacterium]
MGISNMMAQLSAEATISRIRRLIADHAVGLENEEDSFSVTSISHILSNLIGKVAAFLDNIVRGFGALMVSLTVIAALCRLSLYLTGVTILAVIIFGFPIFMLRKSFQQYSANIYRSASIFTMTTLRNLRNFYFLRIVGTNQTEAERLNRFNDSIMHQSKRYIWYSNLNIAWPQFAGIFVVVAIILANQKFQFLETVALVPFVYLLVQLASSISQVSTSIGQIQFNLPFVEEMIFWKKEFESSHLRSQKNKSMSGKNQQRPLTLTASNLEIGRKESLLKHLNFSLTRGDFLLIAGDSGKGKTTLLMTLIGIVSKRSGTIFWNELNLEQCDLSFLRSRVGYSGAEPFLVDDTLRNNLLYGTCFKPTYEDIQKALTIAQCDFIQEIANGLDHSLREGGEGISAGQKQRLSIARAILRKPDLLILDEATANIDESTERKILLSIRQEYPEMAIIAVSHRQSLRQFAKNVLEI